MTSFVSDLTHEQLLAVLAEVPDTVVFVDEELKVRFVNHLQPGFSAEDVHDASAPDFVLPEFREEFREHLSRVLETGEVSTFEIPVATAEDETKWFEGTLSPIYEDGAVSGVLVVTTNVTARHIAEEQVDQLRKLIPVCSWCGQIRDDEGYWSSVEKFVEETSGGRVTHGMCPECETKANRSGTDS